MTQQSFDIGRQSRLDIIVNGAPLRSITITDFETAQDTIQLKSRPLNGRTRHRTIYDGWTGSFSLDREGPALDNFFAQEEENYYAGLNNSVVYITQTIREADGAVSQYRFEGVALKYDSPGRWAQDDKVPVKASFMASARRKVV